jgi:methanesulfonate monooxygenase subunit beta
VELLPLQEEIRLLIGRTSLLLDEERYDDFLGACDAAFTYRATTFSPELGKEMVWLRHDRASFELMISMLPRHVRIQGRFSRHAMVSDIKVLEQARVRVVSRLMMVHTTEEGRSSLFLSGLYDDTVSLAGRDGLCLSAREVRLDTRDLGPGVHIPI